MVAKKENGRVRFDLASAINLLPIIITIIIAAFVLSGQLAGLEARMNSAEQHIGELRKFKNEGHRFTSEKGEALKERIISLESWSKTTPHLGWFDEFRQDMKMSVKEIRGDLNQLALNLNSLEQAVKNKK